MHVEQFLPLSLSNSSQVWQNHLILELVICSNVANLIKKQKIIEDKTTNEAQLNTPTDLVSEPQNTEFQIAEATLSSIHQSVPVPLTEVPTSSLDSCLIRSARDYDRNVRGLFALDENSIVGLGPVFKSSSLEHIMFTILPGPGDDLSSIEQSISSFFATKFGPPPQGFLQFELSDGNQIDFQVQKTGY